MVDKELAGSSDTKSGAQHLVVHVETRDEWCPSGVGTGADIAEHLCQRHGQWDQVLKFADDTKLWGGTSRWREGIPSRDLDTFERWADANLMKFNKVKCQILYLGQGNPRYTHRLGSKVI